MTNIASSSSLPTESVVLADSVTPTELIQSIQQRRKFHGLTCICVFCLDYYDNDVCTQCPNWECFCPECTEVTIDDMIESVDNSDIRQYLRRANNCFCQCGVCANCVSNIEFFYTVFRHKQSQFKCCCPFCDLYDTTVANFKL